MVRGPRVPRMRNAGNSARPVWFVALVPPSIVDGGSVETETVAPSAATVFPKSSCSWTIGVSAGGLPLDTCAESARTTVNRLAGRGTADATYLTGVNDPTLIEISWLPGAVPNVHNPHVATPSPPVVAVAFVSVPLPATTWQPTLIPAS